MACTALSCCHIPFHLHPFDSGNNVGGQNLSCPNGGISSRTDCASSLHLAEKNKHFEDTIHTSLRETSRRLSQVKCIWMKPCARDPLGAFPAHRQTKAEFTQRQKEVGAQLPSNIFGPLGNTSQGHARAAPRRASADPVFREHPGAGKTTQLRHNLDTVSWVEKLNIDPRLCSYLLEHQQSLNFKVLKDASLQSFFTPVAQIAFAMQKPTHCFHTTETADNTSQGGAKQSKVLMLSLLSWHSNLKCLVKIICFS